MASKIRARRKSKRLIRFLKALRHPGEGHGWAVRRASKVRGRRRKHWSNPTYVFRR